MHPVQLARLSGLRYEVKSRTQHLGRLLFSKYLLFTNVGISISLSGVGDVLEQHYELFKKEHDKWDPKRTMRMSISGMTIGILCHHWYKFLDAKIPGRTIRTVMKKVLVDQIVCSPLCISVFFVTLGFLENSSWHEIREEVKAKAWRLYAAEWVVWPPAQIINFYWLPLRYRVLYDNTISLGYDVYTSYVKHDDSDEQNNVPESQKQKNLTNLDSKEPEHAIDEESK